MPRKLAKKKCGYRRMSFVELLLSKPVPTGMSKANSVTWTDETARLANAAPSSSPGQPLPRSVRATTLSRKSAQILHMPSLSQSVICNGYVAIVNRGKRRVHVTIRVYEGQCVPEIAITPLWH